jgi:hypothetical protein
MCRADHRIGRQTVFKPGNLFRVCRNQAPGSFRTAAYCRPVHGTSLRLFQLLQWSGMLEFSDCVWAATVRFPPPCMGKGPDGTTEQMHAQPENQSV